MYLRVCVHVHVCVYVYMCVYTDQFSRLLLCSEEMAKKLQEEENRIAAEAEGEVQPSRQATTVPPAVPTPTPQQNFHPQEDKKKKEVCVRVFNSDLIHGLYHQFVYSRGEGVKIFHNVPLSFPIKFYPMFFFFLVIWKVCVYCFLYFT